MERDEFESQLMSKYSPILILGMHRSGTSCLTGTLEEAGLYLGEVNTQAGFNKKGNREHRSAMDVHDAVLNRVGASWDNPPAQDPDWLQSELNRLAVIIETFPSDRLWGLKDPRVLFMLPGWSALTAPKFIGTFRHPAEVVDSLVFRAKAWEQEMDEALAYKLWAAYNGRMLAQYAKTPFDIIRFDIDPQDYETKIKQAGAKLGLTVPDSLSFRDARLHNQRRDNADIPAALLPIWEALNALSL